ncbi:Uncharacterized protein PBTT_01967 [Plasmodiophora brassicae]
MKVTTFLVLVAVLPVIMAQENVLKSTIDTVTTILIVGTAIFVAVGVGVAIAYAYRQRQKRIKRIVDGMIVAADAGPALGAV